MVMKTGFARPLHPFVTASSGDRDENDLIEPRRPLKLPSDVEAVKDRHAEIQQDDLGTKIFRDLDRLFAIMRLAGVVAAAREKQCKHFRRSLVVVNNEDAAKRVCLGVLCGHQVTYNLSPSVESRRTKARFMPRPG